MKRLIIFSLMAMLFCITSCSKEVSEKNDLTWTGQERIQHLIPVCIIWYKQLPSPAEAWRPYKAFSQADANDMRNIILHLTSPETEESNLNIESENKLSLIFYNGCPEKLTMREVYFELEDHIFIGPLGKSNVLAEILLEQKAVDPFFYYPYSDLGSGHYHDDFYHILEVKKSLQKRAEELMKQKELEMQLETQEDK